MRILLLNYEFPPLGGGGGVAAYKLAKGFIGLGYQVDYITSRFRGLKKFEVIDGINVYRTKIFGRKDLATATMISMFSYLFSGFFKGLSLCFKNKYSFINTQFVVPTGPLGYILSRIFRLENILTILGGDVYDPSKGTSPHNNFFMKWAVRFLMNRADRIVVESNDIKEKILKYYKFTKTVNIIPLPYQNTEFDRVTRSELGLKSDKKYFVSVGRLIKRKGFQYLIKALKFFEDDIECLIIGDGPEEGDLMELTKSLGLRERVHFLGFLSEEKKFQYLAVSDLYVLSSIHEGFGIVLQEAMQVGLPIVSTDCGGPKDFIESGVNGILVNIEDEGALASGVKEIFNNQDLRERVVRNNLERIKSFALPKIAQDYLNLYES